ncbi:MAG: malectin domain-containing carbohydrate-binding protein, partial [candidate division KSB1 bacterium]|nr:malectin domain-containing carbohydrate-binding protein [candidate division KSB1 bacterium]
MEIVASSKMLRIVILLSVVAFVIGYGHQTVAAPTLSVSPLVLDYGFTLNSLTLTIKNAGDGTLSWSANENPTEAWITIVGTNSGNLTAGQTAQVQVDILRSGLPQGPNYGEIQVTSNAGNQTVDIIVEIGPTPTTPILYLEPSVLDFNINLTSLKFKVKNRGVGTLTWQAAEDPETSWITSISPSSGSLASMEESESTVLVSRFALNNGIYKSLITISSNAGNQQIEVEMIVGSRPAIIRANVGGTSYTDVNSNFWSTDRPYHEGAWGHVRGHPYNVTADIKNTQDDALYQDELFWLDAYRFDVSNGNYTVTLHFAELYYNYNNGRVFDLYIENQLMLDDFDIYRSVGFQTATSRKFTNIPVTDGRLDVEFVHIKAHGELTAIELFSEIVAAPYISINPTSLQFNATVGGSNPPSQTITVTNTGGGTLAWTATEQPNQSWLSLSNTSGGSGDQVTVAVTIAGLSAGTYNGTVRISDPNASNNPVDVPVTLTVSSSSAGRLTLQLRDHSY